MKRVIKVVRLLETCPKDGFDLAEAALIASGVRSRQQREAYLARLSELAGEIAGEVPVGDAIARARTLFHWLWCGKPHRYKPGGEFRLNRVLRNQLSPGKVEVGNCLGLTLLYNCLAQRLGLEVKAVYLEQAFEGRPHVFSLLLVGERTIDIENILPEGFDYRGHRDNPGRQVWGDRGLVADVYLSRGNEFFQQGKPARAVVFYSKAIRLNPRYSKAYLNRGMALTQLGRLEETRKDLGRMA